MIEKDELTEDDIEWFTSKNYEQKKLEYEINLKCINNIYSNIDRRNQAVWKFKVYETKTY